MTANSPPVRRSSRVNITCPVRISGQLREHAPFDEDAQLVTISKYGGKLKTRLSLQVGMHVKVKPRHGKKAAILKVVWVGQENSPRAGEMGLECDGGIARIVGIYFPGEPGPGKRAGQADR